MDSGRSANGSRNADEANTRPSQVTYGTPWVTLPGDTDSRQVRQSVVGCGMYTTGVAASSAAGMKAM